MKLALFAHDVVGIWLVEGMLLTIPAIIAGAGIGYAVRRWSICLIVSALAGFGFLYVLNANRPLHPHRELGLAELVAWSTILTMPVLLAMTSLGYFAVAWLWRRRRLKAPA